MKKLRILVCALFVLFGGLVLVGCGDEAMNFNVNKIVVDETKVFTYDGEAHAVAVSYKGVNVGVKYALEEDKKNFKSLEELQTINAGTYKIYYRLTADGYETYTSPNAIEITILPKEVSVTVSDYIWIKSYNEAEFSIQYNIPTEYDIEVEFDFGESFDMETAQYGEEYPINCTSVDPNYTIVSNSAKMRVSDCVEVKNSYGALKNCYSNIYDAIEHADLGDTCVLNGNFMIDKTIEITKPITIVSENSTKTLIMDSEFTPAQFAGNDVASIFNLSSSDAVLTLKDVILNGNQVARGISAFAGKVVIDNATIINGNKTDKWRSGGVYITNSASFEMSSGYIAGNSANDEEYTKYCADLWIGANATGSLVSISGGIVGDIFVNSNAYSAKDAGKFILNGGNVSNIYVEYDSRYGARFEYVKGSIANLMIAYQNDKTNNYGSYYQVIPVEGTVYNGGQIYSNDTDVTSFTDITYNATPTGLVDNKTYIFEGCTFKVPINITNKVGLVFNNCTFSYAAVGTCLSVTSVSSLVVNNCTFNRNSNGGYAIDVNLYSATCENLVISNNIFNVTNDENASISIKTRLGLTDSVTEDWANDQTQGLINCQAVIIGNDFTTSNNTICIGEGPTGDNTAANTTTGDFDVLVSGNFDEVIVYNKFKDNAYVTEDEASKVTVQEKGVYDSTKVD